MKEQNEEPKQLSKHEERMVECINLVKEIQEKSEKIRNKGFFSRLINGAELRQLNEEKNKLQEEVQQLTNVIANLKINQQQPFDSAVKNVAIESEGDSKKGILQNATELYGKTTPSSGNAQYTDIPNRDRLAAERKHALSNAGAMYGQTPASPDTTYSDVRNVNRFQRNNLAEGPLPKPPKNPDFDQKLAERLAQNKRQEQAPASASANKETGHYSSAGLARQASPHMQQLPSTHSDPTKRPLPTPQTQSNNPNGPPPAVPPRPNRTPPAKPSKDLKTDQQKAMGQQVKEMRQQGTKDNAQEIGMSENDFPTPPKR